MIGRFAPTPSGRMHLGNAFSCLLAWLSVRAQGGELVLRMEDLDPQRTSAAFADQIRRDLEWLGLTWDRETAPQSRRTQAYQEQFSRLQAMGLIYPCYCTRSQLHSADAPHPAEGVYVYDGRCRSLSPAQRAAFDRAPAWRVRVPDQVVSLVDGVQGRYAENLAQDCGDFVVRRADSVFVYQLAVVVEDQDAGITEVVRGSDLLSSTPRQMYLQKLLGFPHPRYNHVPMLLSPQGRRLSKRDQDLELGALRAGVEPEVLLGYLAHWAGLLDAPEPCSPWDLVPLFSWDLVPKGDIRLPAQA